MKNPKKPILLLIFSLCVVLSLNAQTYTWVGYPTNAASWNPSANFNVTTSTAGGGSFDRRASTAGGTSPISGTAGNIAQNCANQTGLRLEMSGSGNSFGTAVWNNSTTVTITFPTYMCAPVTFNIFDMTEALWDDTGGASGKWWVYYQDKVTISATNNLAAAVTPTCVSVGPIDNTVVGSSLVLVANRLNGACLNQPISVGVAGQLINTITIVYANQDIPTHCPAPSTSPYRYGICQYQYIFISPITGTAPPTASITALPLACGSSTTTLTATTSAGSPTYSWTGPGGSTIVCPTCTSTSVTGAGTYTLTVNPGGCSGTATYVLTPSGAPPNVTAAAAQTVTCTTPTISASSSSSPVTFSWAGPGIASGGSTATPTITAAGTYTVTVTNTSTGCTNTATVVATMNNTPPVVTASSNNNINCTTPNATLTGVSAGNTMVWNGGALVNAANPATVSTAGTYTVTSTNPGNGCTATQTVVVTGNTTPPVVTSSSTGNLTCTTTTSTLTGVSAGNTMVWNGGALVNAANPATVSAAGTYTVTSTSASNNCTSTSTVTITSNTTPPVVTASSNHNINCTFATSTLTGVSAGSSMVWNGGALSNAANPATVSAAGTYTVTATGANGCTNTATIAVTSNTTPPVVTASSNNNISCITPTSTLTGVSAGNTMVWNGGALVNAANPATVSVAGTYTVTATNAANGCTNTTTVTVTGNTTIPTVTSASTGNITCLAANSTLTGTSAGNTMVWNGGALVNAANPATVSAAGTYTVTATNASNGCTNTSTVTITANTTVPTVTSASSGNLTCTTLTSTLTGTSAGNTMVWNGGALVNASNPATISAAGTYTVTSTNPVNGCTNTSTVNITSNTTPPTVTAASSGNITCSVTSSTLTGTSAGNTMVWNGGSLVNAANPATVTTAGTYTITATNPVNGCTATQTVVVTSSGAVPNISIASPAQITCAVTSIILTGSSTTPSATFQWTSGPGTPTNTISTAGTYTLTVTDPSNSCTSSQTVVVSSNTAPPSVTSASSGNLTCTTLNTTLTGTSAGNTMVWNGGALVNAANPAIVNAAGSYTVTSTDPTNGCTNTSTVTITSNTTPPTVTASSSGVLACSVSSVTLTGTSPGSIMVWNGGALVNAANPATVMVVGTYTVTATDPSNGCIANQTVTVTSSSALPNVSIASPSQITCTSSSVSLFGSSTTPGAIFQWTLGPASPGYTVSAVGTYTLTVTDPASGCTTSQSVTVSSNTTPPNATAGSPLVIGCTPTSGTINVNSTTVGATYSWAGPGIVSGATSSSATVNAAGTYTVTVTDPANGCTSTANVLVTNNTTAPNVTAGGTLTLDCISTSGSVTASSTTTGATYTWTGAGITGGGTTSSATVNAAGTYTVTVTDPANGCTSTGTVVVASNITAPNVSGGGGALLGCTTNSASISANSTTSGATYSWTGPGIVSGGTTTNPTVNAIGTYTVTVTDPSNGCSTSDTVVVSASPGPIANAGNSVSITSGTSTTLTASGGGSYVWSTGDTTNVIIVSPTTTTDYCVTVTNLSGCSDSSCVRIFVETQCPSNKDLQVPNAFSPNVDGRNDRFCLQGWNACITDFQIFIYDRWGEKVFESTDASFCWDGNYKGKNLDPGVFVYYITATLTNTNEEIAKKGNISLIR